MRNFLLLISCFCCFAIFSQTPLQVTVRDDAGNENFNVSCTNNLVPSGCLRLNVTYPEIKTTVNYDVAAITYNLPAPLTQGNALSANYDDLFASKLNLPFKFCFYNQSFESLVVGSNGMVTFDESQLGKINYPNVDWPNPDPRLPVNSIFGVYHDMIFSAADPSEIYYTTTGVAPQRRFIISYYQGRVTGCTERSSLQIVLYETTNIIDVFIERKDLPCDDSKYTQALVGIMNADGSVGVSPPGRNKGKWSANQEGWRFTPIGTPVTPQIIWTNAAGDTVATESPATICPTQNEVYTARVQYNICGAELFELKDEFNLTFDPSYPAARDYSKNYCTTTSQIINLNDFKPNLTSQNPNNFNFKFYDDPGSAEAGGNDYENNLNNYNLTANKTFYVRIENKTIPGCFRIAKLELTLLTKTLPTNPVEICDTNNDGIEKDYELKRLNAELFPTMTSGITYFASEADADSNVNPITRIDVTTATTVWIRVTTDTCSFVLGPLNFKFKPGVNLNTPINYTYSMCDINDNNTEPFNYAMMVGPLISTDPGVIFKAYQTEEAAMAGTSGAWNSIKEGQYPVYIRVEIPNGCFAIATVNMDVTFTRVKVQEKKVYICFNGTDDVAVDVVAQSAGMLIDPLGLQPVFYKSPSDATKEKDPVDPNTLQPFVITEDGNLVTKIWYVRFTQATDCYTIRPLSINLVHPVIINSSVTVCDVDNNNTELVPLAQFRQVIVGTQNATVLFYETQADVAAGNAITSTTVNVSKTVYVKITSYGCAEVYPFTITLVSTPQVTKEVNVDLRNICDNNNDGVERYNLRLTQPEIYSGTDVTFSYYRNYNPSTRVFSNPIEKPLDDDPSEFRVTKSTTVYAKIEFAGKCFSVSTINIQVSFKPAVKLLPVELVRCDPDRNLNEEFDLDEKEREMFDSSNTELYDDMKVTYHELRSEAEAALNPITDKKYKTTNSEYTVWARFESKTTLCYSVSPINLLTFNPPKAVNSNIKVCDDNLDGKFEVNLMNYRYQTIEAPNYREKFSFYRSGPEATIGKDSIRNPQSFIFDDFPKRIYVRAEIPGCFDVAYIDLLPGNKVIIKNSAPYSTTVCRQGNSAIANLTQFQNQIYSPAGATFTYYASMADLNAGNAIPKAQENAYAFETSGGIKTIYVKVSVPGLCSDKAEIQITVRPAPEFDIATQYICPDGSLYYEAKVPGFNITKYVWTDPSGKVLPFNSATVYGLTQLGTYQLTVTADNGCSYTDSFDIQYFDTPQIDKLVAVGNTFTVYASGTRPIVYSMDGINWQEQNVFTNLLMGVHTFYVRYVDDVCVNKLDGVILNIPNVITPNGDGFNDEWRIKNLNVFGGQATNVKIYDRFQTLIFEQTSNTEIVWDGKIRGREIPTTSYWYVITLPDGRQFTGWIVLKNRN